ncbi:MAG: hypothetical protein ACRC2Y_05010 [Aeromonas veronii]
MIGIAEKHKFFIETLGSVTQLKKLIQDPDLGLGKEQVTAFIDNFKSALDLIEAERVEQKVETVKAAINGDEAAARATFEQLLKQFPDLRGKLEGVTAPVKEASVKKAPFAFWYVDPEGNPAIAVGPERSGSAFSNVAGFDEWQKRAKAVDPKFTRTMAMVKDHEANINRDDLPNNAKKHPPMTKEEFLASKYNV